MTQADVARTAEIKNEEVGDFQDRKPRRGYCSCNTKVRQSTGEEFENRNLGLTASDQAERNRPVSRQTQKA